MKDALKYILSFVLGGVVIGIWLLINQVNDLAKNVTRIDDLQKQIVYVLQSAGAGIRQPAQGQPQAQQPAQPQGK